MSVETSIAYTTSDGKQFDDRQEAETHEQWLTDEQERREADRHRGWIGRRRYHGFEQPLAEAERKRDAADKEITRLKPLVADEKNIGKLIDVCDDISCFGGKYLDSAKSDNECSSASNASRIPACRTVCSTTGLGTVCYARSSKTAKDARSSCLDGRTASQRHESMGIRSDPYALDPGIRPRAGDALRPAAGKAGRTPYTGRSATRVPIPALNPYAGKEAD